MKAFAVHFLSDLKAGIRDKSLLLMNYLFPLAFYLVIGGIMPQLNPEYGKILIPSMMIFGILVSTVLGMPNSLVASRNNGIFRSYKINGISKLSMLSIPTVSTIFHTLIVTIIIFITSPILFGAKLPEHFLGVLLVFICTVIACSGLALLIGTIADNTSVTVLYAQLLFLPSMLIGGLIVPAKLLPSSISGIGRLLPTTYAMDAFQGLATDGSSSINPALSLGILLACGIISFILSGFLFRLDNNTSVPKSKLWALTALIPLGLGALLL